MSQTIGHGSKLSLGTPGTTESWADLACTSIDFGSNKIDTPDNTDMLTPGHTRTYIGGMEAPGDISVKFLVKPGDVVQAAFTAAKDTLAHDFKVSYPVNLRTLTFSGIITSIDESIPDDKIPSKTMKIQITGPITVVETTGS